jgi:hypothetical protein
MPTRSEILPARGGYRPKTTHDASGFITTIANPDVTVVVVIIAIGLLVAVGLIHFFPFTEQTAAFLATES